MAQTYLKIQRQIETLQRQAEKLKATEVAGVVERIKVAIDHYGLTAEQLGLGGKSGALTPAKSSKRAAKKAASKRASSTAYADENGNSWGGRGPRPRWLREALADGKSLEEFASIAGAAPTVKAETAKAPAKRKKRVGKTYRDSNGNSWSGMGPRPKWLKDAIEGGATLEQLAQP